MATCSIVVPTYNGEKSLKRALDSALNQTYKDFEIILIDDGSTDSSPQICDEYGSKYDFIHVFHQKNMGVTKTRERLLDEANGKYIFWLDQDDYLEPTLLEKAVKAFEMSGADVVTWGMFFLASSGNIIVNYADELGIEKWKKNTFWGLCPAIYGYAAKKELWAERERVPTDVDIAEDVWFTSQIIPKAKTIFSIKESLYYYNSANEGSFSKIPTADNISRGAFVYYKVIKRNQKLCPSEIPLCLKIARTLLLDVYCFNKLDHSLTKYQEELTMIALKDLFQSYPQKKIKRLYLIQFCALRGIDFMCRWYGRHRIKRLKRRNK